MYCWMNSGDIVGSIHGLLQSSHLTETMHYVYALTHKDKQWQNVGGGMNLVSSPDPTLSRGETVW